MTMTQRQTIETALEELRGYRRCLRGEALRTPDAKSRDDRLAEISRVTARINRLLARVGE